MPAPALLFSLANGLALSGWLVLAANAWMRRSPMLWPARVVPTVLALGYLVTVAPLIARGGTDFGSLGSVQALFANPHWALAGWVHYLAFDLLVGTWQVREAAERAIPRVVLLLCLFLTFMLGPVGWLLYLVTSRITARRGSSDMTLDALLAYLHHLAVFSVGAVIAVELVLLSGEITPARLRQLGTWDGAYGALAVLALCAGGLRSSFGAKGWDFYADNPVYWIKLGIFVTIGLISIVPTVRFIRWRRAGAGVAEADRLSTRRLVLLQAALFALLPLAAALMARGWGHA